MKRVLLTGATGLVGARVLANLLGRDDVERIRLLIAGSEAQRSEALERLAELVGPLPKKVDVVAGDLRRPRFGFSIEAWDELGESFDSGFHCAESSLSGDLESARQANLRPVESWIELLKRFPETRLHHLSSAFIAGSRTGLLTEFDLDCGQSFRNPWEQSKYEAEKLLRESRVSERVTVYRPSHTVGDSSSGAALELGRGYLPLRALCSGGFLPGDPGARLDLVPVDYVAGALVTLAADPESAGKTFHLVAGWQGSRTVAELVDLATAGGRGRRPRFLPQLFAPVLRLLGAVTFGGISPAGARHAAHRDYLRQSCVFNDFLARAALDSHEIVCPEPGSWLELVIRSAEERSWDDGRAARAETTMIGPELSAAEIQAAEEAGRASVEAFQQKHFHRVGDVDVAYRDIGEGEPVIFLHGFAGASAWDGVVDRLRGRYRCLVVETLGLGDSKAPLTADFGLPAQATMVRGLLSALGLDSAHLVGNDTGGAIAQLFAARYPRCVKSLVLSDCDAFDNWPPPQVERLRAVMRLPGGTGLLTTLMSVPAIAGSRLGFRRLVYDKSLLTRERLARYLEPVAADGDRKRRLRRFFLSLDPSCTQEIAHLLRQFERPTLIVWGCENDYWTTSWAKKLYDEIPGARRLELIPFAGISCHEEQPEHFAGLLKTHFAEVAEAREAQ